MRRPRAGRGAPQFHRLLWAGGIAALVAAAPALSGASVLTRELAYPGLEVTLDESGLWSVLTLPGAAPEASLGEPTLPAAEVILPLPAGMHVDRVLCEVLEETPLALARPVMPYRGERSTVQPELPEPAPDSAIYGAAGLFPPYSARAVNEVRLSTGACYAVVRIYPVRYAPSAGELLWAQRVRLTVELTEKSASADGLRSKRPMAAFPEAEAGSGPWRQIRLDEPGFLPREVPSVDGAPVEYVIIVPGDDELAAAWQPLADWKTACGHPARVIRTDWIDANYPNGSDPAERVRLFLQDGYVHWGLKWALIGGDVTEVPIRYGYSRMLGSGAGTAIATDYYYACLERTWDADRNGLFGQAAGAGVSPGDSADTTPDIHVGRVSARTAHDVEDYLEKYFRYVRDPNLDGYLDSILLLGEVLFDVEWSLRGRSGQPDCYREQCSADSGCRSNGEGGWICANRDGADDILALRTLLQGELGLPHDIKLLIERAEYYGERMPELLPYMELESANSTMAHMSSGYNIVFQVGHGYHDRWAVGDGRLLTGDLVSLSNGGDGSYFIAYAVNCHSAAVDYDSFGETMVTMADDGAVAYMGCTNADFPDAARPFSQNFFRFLYSEPGATVGDGYYGSLGARALTGTSINTESQDRFLLYTQILLGEPGMPFWQSTPGQMAVTLPDHTNDEVPLGISELRVSVNPSGDAVDRAQVCLHKSGEVYSVGVLGGGAHDIELPFHPRTTGDFSLVVTAPGYLPVEVEGTVVGASASEALHLAAMTVVDNGTGSSRGNGNTQAEPGERLRLQLEVGNAGSQAAADVEARLRLGATAPAGCAQISDSVATLGTIAAGGSASDASAFLITIPSELDAVFGDADRVQLPFTVVLDPGGSAVKAAVTLELSRPRVGLSTNHQSGATGVQDLWVGVANQGKGTASHLLSVLTSENDSDIDVIGTGILRVGDIAPGDTALAGPFSVDIFDALGHLEFALVDTFQSPDDTLHVRTLDLDEPGPPLSPALIGQLEAMQVTWSTPAAPGQDGILGYKVYRAPSTEGPYEDVVPGILTSHRFLNDVGLGSLVFYSYRIAAVDRSGNIGMTSTPVSAYTSPGVPVGWPNFLEVPTKASPLICELDGWTSNGREIIFCAETVYAFHGDGSEVVDGDNADRTRGPFTKAEDPYLGDSFWGKAAAADIDADGDVEVLAVAFNHTNEPGTYPGTHGELFCWGPDGTVEWVYSFLKNSGISWSSPVLADLDSDDRIATATPTTRTKSCWQT
jgi:hypothetical protein